MLLVVTAPYPAGKRSIEAQDVWLIFFQCWCFLDQAERSNSVDSVLMIEKKP